MPKPLTVQYFSDTHIEMMPGFNPTIPVLGDVLVLAGDIGSIRQPLTRSFLTTICQKFPHVIYITGNHEYYQNDGFTIQQVDFMTAQFCATIPNMHFLNHGSWVHPSGQVAFHGCTLWSHVPAQLEDTVEASMNDYNLIYTCEQLPLGSKPRKLTVSDSNRMFDDQFAWLKSAVESSKTPKNIVVTHHVPSYDMNPDKYKGDPINCAFSTDLNKFMEEHPQINTWVCGHTHDVKQMKFGSTNCCMCCIGYFFNAGLKKYDSTFTV